MNWRKTHEGNVSVSSPFQMQSFTFAFFSFVCDRDSCSVFQHQDVLLWILSYHSPAPWSTSCSLALLATFITTAKLLPSICYYICLEDIHWLFVCKQLSRYSTNSKYIAMLVLPQLPPQLAGSVTVLRLTSAAGNATSADLQPRLWWREHLTVDHWFKSCLVRHGELVVSLYLSPSL